MPSGERKWTRQGMGRSVSSSRTVTCTQFRPRSTISNCTRDVSIFPWAWSVPQFARPISSPADLTVTVAEGMAATSTYAWPDFSFCASPQPLKSSARKSFAGFSGKGNGNVATPRSTSTSSLNGFPASSGCGSVIFTSRFALRGKGASSLNPSVIAATMNFRSAGSSLTDSITRLGSRFSQAHR